MFYGIYGDTDGDTPQVIGEASWLMARTCFPNDDLNGNSGHGAVDVTCEFKTLLFFKSSSNQTSQDILFTGNDAVLPSSALNKNYVTNFSTLRSMGDKLITALAKNLNLVSGGGPSTTTLTTKVSTTTSTGTGSTSTSCSWAGHCIGKVSLTARTFGVFVADRYNRKLLLFQ
jgi:chitosanase